MTKRDRLSTYDEHEQGLDQDLNVLSDEQRARSARAVHQLSARQAFLNHIGKVDGDQKPTVLANLFGQHLSTADAGPLRIAIYLRVSTEEQAKVGGTAGRLNYAIQAGVAQYHSDNLKLEVLKGMTTKASQGGTPYRAPLGYLNKQEIVDNIVVRSVIVDDVRAPLVRWAFSEYATGGWTLLTLTEALTDKGLLTRKTPKVSSKPLTSGALYNLLRNPYYMGVLPYRGVYYDGTHAPLVDGGLLDVRTSSNTRGDFPSFALGGHCSPTWHQFSRHCAPVSSLNELRAIARLRRGNNRGCRPWYSSHGHSTDNTCP